MLPVGPRSPDSRRAAAFAAWSALALAFVLAARPARAVDDGTATAASAAGDLDLDAIARGASAVAAAGGIPAGAVGSAVRGAAAGAVAAPVPEEFRLPAPALAPPRRTGPTPWRAVGEEALILGIGELGYAVTRPPAPGAHPVPIGAKLRLAPGAAGFDADSRQLNYIGHPVDGWVFYTFARGNRLGVGPSLGLTFATAWAWELLEYNELLSFHDIAASTAGGFALGEAFTEVALWLRQQGRVGRAASILFQIPRAAHDLLDRAPPPPPERFGVADVSAWITGGRSAPAPWGVANELRFGARARLVRAGEVGEPGSGWQALLDGNVSSLSFELTTSGAGVVGVEVGALASLAGLYGRSFDDAGDGHDLLATASFGFDYLRSPVEVGGVWAADDLSLLRVPGVEVVARVRGGVHAEVGLESAVTLGGVDPLALQGLATDVPGAPGVLRFSGYYHGLGWMLAPRASVAAGPVELSASYRVDRLGAITQRDVAPPPDGGRLALEDERVGARVTIAWRTPARGVTLVGGWERVDRWGRAGDATASFRGTSTWLGVALRPPGGA